MMNYIQKKMNKKIISIFICLLLMGIIPVAAGMDNYKDKIETEASDGELMIALVFGFFPKCNNFNITYFGITQFQWISIPKDKFEGYIGTFIILGSYDSSPYL